MTAQARGQEQEPERAPARGTATATRPLRRASTGATPGEQNRVAVRDLPAAAFTPEPPR